MQMSTQMLSRAVVCSLLTAAVLLSVPSVSEASSRLSRGLKIGSLSAKLLQKPYDSLTGTQQNTCIYDPVAPEDGSTSVFYDRGYATEFGTTRLSISDLLPGPGYDVSGLVEVRLVTGTETPSSFSSTSNGARASFTVYQNLEEFLENPAGEETGYAQVFFTRNEDPTGRFDIGPFEEQGFEQTDEDGVVEDGVDTHAFSFVTKPGTPENAEIPITHFASDGSLTGLPDRLRGIEEGEEFVINFDGLSPATVTTPEPGAVALLVFGALGLLRRRARR